MRIARIVRYCSALLAFVVPASLAARCREPHDCNPTSISDREICNFHKVDDDLYRGARPTCSGLAKLEALGIRTFIDLGGGQAAIHRCRGEAEQAGLHIILRKISLVQIVVTGISDTNVRELFALIQRSPKPVFIACSLGRDRTGAIVAVYRMRRGEMRPGETLEEARYYGYRTVFRGLRKAVERYQDPENLRLLPFPSLTQDPPQGVCRPAALRRNRFECLPDSELEKANRPDKRDYTIEESSGSGSEAGSGGGSAFPAVAVAATCSGTSRGRWLPSAATAAIN